MNSTFDAVLRSWPFEPWVLIGLLLTAAIYLRGWRVLHRRHSERWPRYQPVAFLSGLALLYLALASPIEPFAALLLQVHMLQHMLLMMAAPPLLWLGAPLLPLVRGLPRSIRTYWIAPLFRRPFLRRWLLKVTHPVPALLLFTAATWFWHLPPIYELALASDRWHYLQHLSFIITALIFWYPVVRPYPSRPAWSPWSLVPYLILADLQNTLLSAVLTFSDQPLYAYYVDRPHLGNLPPLEDQAVAGVLMWVPGSLVFLGPLFVIGVRLLFGGTHKSRQRLSARVALPLIAQREPTVFDALRLPLLGRFLRWKHARVSMQIPLVLIAGIIIYDGLRGPAIGAMNLAGVLPWIHWRGLVVLGLLSAGNVFCMACPFMLPRTLARRWLPANLAWPRLLRNKWLAVGLLVGFLWTYEAFALWDSPWLTAWIVLAYFAMALVIDGFFRGASFCKYVCPIGQFNFVQSLVSPLEIKVRNPAVCDACQSKDCIRGRGGIPGCELHLYQPRKAGNLDCTFCLDCVHACPHDNIGIQANYPGAELWRDPQRSGIGRLSRRPDVAALAVVLVFGAFVNASWMTAPVADWLEQFSPSRQNVLLLLALTVLPGLLMAGVSFLSRRWGQLNESIARLATRFSFALVPIGFAMWLTHYSFHFFTSYATVIPTVQRFGADFVSNVLGNPEWSCACCIPTASWLLRLEIVFLDLGLLLSLYSGYRIAVSQTNNLAQTFKVLMPWAGLIVLLFALGIWSVFQPMQMRGTMPMIR